MLRIVLRLPPVFWLMSLWLAFIAVLVWVACPRMFQLDWWRHDRACSHFRRRFSRRHL